MAKSDSKIENICQLNEVNQRIIDSAPLSIIITDKKGNIIFVNEYFKRFSDSPALGRNIFKMPFFIKQDLCPLYKKLLADGTPVRKEGCPNIVFGDMRYVNIVAVALKNDSEGIDGALSMAIDVTETVSAKNDLQELNAELERRVESRTKELFESNIKLAKSLESKVQFIADASHELRTPLSIIKLNLEIGRDEIKKELYASVDREVDKITGIIEDLTLATSIDGGREQVRFKEVDLNRLMRNVIIRVSAFAKEKGIKIICQKGCETKIRGDESKLEKLFLNIIRNAIKYGNKGGWIKIEGNKKSKLLNINISDNGIGIPEDELAHIFDRFYRSSLSVKTGEGGFGLGLAICKWIVDQHKGSISVKSTVGKGSIFAINLPLEQARA